MKREYESPDFEVIAFDSADVITGSPTNNQSDTGNNAPSSSGLF